MACLRSRRREKVGCKKQEKKITVYGQHEYKQVFIKESPKTSQTRMKRSQETFWTDRKEVIIKTDRPAEGDTDRWKVQTHTH